MNQSMERSVRQTRFAIEDLQKRIAVLEATKEDLERQIAKLNDSVPEDEIDPNAQKEGYVSYGSYAQSVIERKKNIRASLDNISDQEINLSEELKMAMEALDSFERVRARQLAAQAEKALKKRAS